jgi:hypothetical protein
MVVAAAVSSVFSAVDRSIRREEDGLFSVDDMPALYCSTVNTTFEWALLVKGRLTVGKFRFIDRNSTVGNSLRHGCMPCVVGRETELDTVKEEKLSTRRIHLVHFWTEKG